MYDPYSVLGLARSAGEDEVKHAFRTLAKRFHPDTPEGASDKGRRFKDLSIAYEILGDARKRRAYDRGEIDAHGNPRPGYKPRPEPQPEPEPAFDLGAARQADPPPRKPAQAQAPHGEAAGASFRSAFEKAFGGNPSGASDTGAGAGHGNGRRDPHRVEDLFAEFFGDRDAGGARAEASSPGGKAFELQITFEEAVLGGSRRVKLPDGKRFDVRIPIGALTGQAIALPAGSDGVVTLAVEPHPFFRREGDDIVMTLPITLNEALNGGKLNVPTLHGGVAMSLPPRTGAGQVLRLKGKGVPARGPHPAGDQLVTLQIVLPDNADPELADLVKRWEAAHPYDPRKKIVGG